MAGTCFIDGKPRQKGEQHRFFSSYDATSFMRGWLSSTGILVHLPRNHYTRSILVDVHVFEVAL